MRPLITSLVLQRAPMRSSARIINCRGLPATEIFSLLGGKTRSISSAMEKAEDIKVRHGGKIRLMPLGGSVTQGVGSSTGAGYRLPLLEMLRKHGFDIEMVGSRKTGSMDNKNHEGWPGLRIDEIESKARISVSRVLPNVFAVNAGSNDCLQSFRLKEAGSRLNTLLEYLWETCPDSTILLSTLIVSADIQTNTNVNFVNDQYRALDKQKANEGKRIVFVDMNCEAGPQVDCLVDGIHPDSDGYEKMAKLWLDGFLEANQRGFLP